MCDTILHEGTEIEDMGDLKAFLTACGTSLDCIKIHRAESRNEAIADDECCLCHVDIPETAKAAGFECVDDGGLCLGAVDIPATAKAAGGLYIWKAARGCKAADGLHDTVSLDNTTISTSSDLLAAMKKHNPDAELFFFPNRKPLDKCLCVVDIYRTAIKNGFRCDRDFNDDGYVVFRFTFAAKPVSMAGKTLTVPGLPLPIKVVTDDEAEQSDWYVCGSSRFTGMELVAQCFKCGETVYHSPLGPEKPKKICLKCVVKVAEEQGVAPEARCSPKAVHAIEALLKEQNESNEGKKAEGNT